MFKRQRSRDLRGEDRDPQEVEIARFERWRLRGLRGGDCEVQEVEIARVEIMSVNVSYAY